MSNNELSAFPYGQMSEQTGQPINGVFSPGMTLRDYFAAKAMQGILAHEGRRNYSTAIARDAYDIADAMLEARGHA